MISDSDVTSPQSVVLSGLGTAVGGLPHGLTFAAQTVGTTSTAQTITITNRGTNTMTFSGIVASSNFAETDTCLSGVAPGGLCKIHVTFTPTTTGTIPGTLTFMDNDGASPQTVTLTGTGQ